MTSEKFLSVKELCKYLDIPKQTIYQLLHRGLMPGAKIGRQWRFKKDSIDKWMEEKEKATMRKEDRRRGDNS